MDNRAKNYFTNELFIFLITELIGPAVVLTEAQGEIIFFTNSVIISQIFGIL